MKLITSAVAILVGLVLYKERAINLVTISAVWLGSFLHYLLFVNHGQPLPQFLVWPLLGATIAALFVLGTRRLLLQEAMVVTRIFIKGERLMKPLLAVFVAIAVLLPSAAWAGKYSSKRTVGSLGSASRS